MRSAQKRRSPVPGTRTFRAQRKIKRVLDEWNRQPISKRVSKQLAERAIRAIVRDETDRMRIEGWAKVDRLAAARREREAAAATRTPDR